MDSKPRNTPDPTAAVNAIRWLERLRLHRFLEVGGLFEIPFPQILVGDDGSVQIAWLSSPHEIDVDFETDGTATIYHKERPVPNGQPLPDSLDLTADINWGLDIIDRAFPPTPGD